LQYLIQRIGELIDWFFCMFDDEENSNHLEEMSVEHDHQLIEDRILF